MWMVVMGEKVGVVAFSELFSELRERVFSHRASSGLKADSAFSLYQINSVCIAVL